jgi:hypothetical protein
LIAARAIALKAFWDWQQGGVIPFLFYNLAEGTYDPSGNSTQGRYTVVFRSNWSQSTDLAHVLMFRDSNSWRWRDFHVS